ncbi:MAG TPA: papain-like cysteine protease family protein [Bryobacteraceae bacterium]|nr:papain-like cysteine protease family protein [Bryobacteraceae bacterium]
MPVKMEKQLESNWCWAAVSASLKNFFSPQSGFQQCHLASPVLLSEAQIEAAVRCCEHPDECNMQAFLEDALAFAGNLHQKLHGYLGFPGIMNEIDAGRPVGVRIEWSDGYGHFLLIDGYRAFGSDAQQVHVSDPFYGASYILHGDLVDNYQNDGIWTDTYFVRAEGDVPFDPHAGGGEADAGADDTLVIGPIVIEE